MITWTDELIAVDALDDPPEPLREQIDPQLLGELADDMAVNGLLQPIGARGPSPKGRYEVVWGHRRTMAARLLGWSMIPARTCPWPVAPELARVAENMQRADLNPREEARAIEKLASLGKPLAEIARIFRRSVGWVDARRELLTWPSELQERVAKGELTFAVARLLADVDHETYRAQLIGEAIRGGATGPVVSVWVAHYAADRERIQRNQETIDVITSRREQFILLYVCESCHEQRDSRESVMLRICPDCLRNLREEQARERSASGS